jgi:hypothetical protein
VKIIGPLNEAARALLDVVAETCPHCGVPVEMVSLFGVAEIRTDPEATLQGADGKTHHVRMVHVCVDVRARHGALRDLCRQIPRG